MSGASVDVPIAEFATLTVELPPGLPKLADESNEMAPPPYIPYSGGASKNGQQRGGNYTPNRRHYTPKKMGEGGSPNNNNGYRGKRTGGGGSTPTTHHHHKNQQQQEGQQRWQRMAKTPKSSSTEHFEIVNPMPLSSLSVPIRGIRNETGVVKYPLLICSQEGTMMLSLAAGVLIEICVDRSFRIVCNDDFMAYVNSGGTVSSVLHKYAKVVHSKEHVHCKFVSANDRLAVVGPEGILFSMDNLSEAYLVSSANGLLTEHAAFAIAKPEFPIQNIDYTLHQMYAESDIGNSNYAKCNEILNKAVYEKKPDGSLLININGIIIKSNSEKGDVVVDAKPIRIDINSKTLSVHLRTPYLDMAIEDRDKCYVKRADKRIHTSRSGMVVSDGTCAISMDQFGRILSCA